jgi:4-amino-4-deoxy-L-arabinose transferase-like glycosyltransferase
MPIAERTLVFAGALLLYLPFAGSYGLWDPWETHYAEVARQMLVRGDLVSLWWPGSPHERPEFWSKPVLPFWLMSAGMYLAGVSRAGGPADELVSGNRAEWAVRVPACLMAALAVYAVYLVTARLASRRAGLLAAVVLATCPMFFLIARQAMTDMFLVGPMTLGLALAALALIEELDQPVARRGRGAVSWPHDRAFYALVLVLLGTVGPQLLVNALQLDGPRWFQRGPLAMAPLALLLAAALVLAARVRQRAPLFLALAGACCGLAVLAKGLVGVGLPVVVLACYLTATGGWRRLREPPLAAGVLLAALALLLVAGPWHLAMYLRHGSDWLSQLYGENQWRRLLLGRHGERGTFEYFLRELGYGVLPWLALAPSALAAIVMRPKAPGALGHLHALGALWLLAGYLMASLSMTKFHHYVLPAIPGLAILVGCFLDQLWRMPGGRTGRLVAVAGAPLLALVSYDLVQNDSAAERLLWLFCYDYVLGPRGQPWPQALDFGPPIAVFAGLFVACTSALAVRRLRRVMVLAQAGVALLFTYFLLDVVVPRVTSHWSLKPAIAAYYQHRRSPDEKLMAYLMHWRGETFYTRNEVHQGAPDQRATADPASDDQPSPPDQQRTDRELQRWLHTQHGRRVYFIFEHQRTRQLERLLPDEARTTFEIIHDLNEKFSVARADL